MTRGKFVLEITAVQVVLIVPDKPKQELHVCWPREGSRIVGVVTGGQADNFLTLASVGGTAVAGAVIAVLTRFSPPTGGVATNDAYNVPGFVRTAEAQ